MKKKIVRIIELVVTMVVAVCVGYKYWESTVLDMIVETSLSITYCVVIFGLLNSTEVDDRQVDP